MLFLSEHNFNFNENDEILECNKRSVRILHYIDYYQTTQSDLLIRVLNCTYAPHKLPSICVLSTEEYCMVC